MDPRGVYIFQTEAKFQIIYGTKCAGKNLEVYTEYAKSYIQKLHEREHAALIIEEYTQDSIPEEISEIVGKLFTEQKSLNHFFPDLESAALQEKKKTPNELMVEDEEYIKKDKKFKP